MDNQSEAFEIAEEAREPEYRHPSFAGQLFVGEFDPKLLYPFPHQSEEDKKEGDAFIEELCAFLKEYLDPDEVDARHEIPQKVIDGMAKMGVFALKIPKKYGGLGFSQTNYNRIVMKVASYCGSTAVLISAHQSIGVPQPLKMFGTEKQKATYFPKFREGAISAFALTEPDVGSDPAQMTSEAVLSEDGTTYTLNGTKLWCTNGTIADVIVVMANTAPKIVKGKERKQITAFILDMRTPGVKVVHRCEFMGLHGIYNGVLEFNDVRIPAENVILGEGRGLAMALATINIGRLTLPAACTGVAKECLTISRRWGKERVQWGLPIGLHEAGREKLAYISATTFAMEAMTWLTSSWADEGKVDIRIEAAMAKLFCTEALWTITDLTLQLRGGRGYETARSLKARGEPPYPVERMMRDCRINTILEGSSEIMKLFLAREAMDPHLQRLMPIIKGKESLTGKLKILGHYCWWYPSQFLPFGSRHREMGPLAKHYRFVDKNSRRLSRAIFYYMARYQEKLEKKQMLLGRLMEIGTDLFAIAATCSYAKDPSAIALADYFCIMARRRIKENFAALTSNDDSEANRLAKSLLDGEMQWLEKGVMEDE